MNSCPQCVRCCRKIQPREDRYEALDYVEELLHEGFDIANVKEEDTLCSGCQDEIIGQYGRVVVVDEELFEERCSLCSRTAKRRCDRCGRWHCEQLHIMQYDLMRRFGNLHEYTEYARNMYLCTNCNESVNTHRRLLRVIMREVAS
jgi:hypothetical protein